MKDGASRETSPLSEAPPDCEPTSTIPPQQRTPGIETTLGADAAGFDRPEPTALLSAQRASSTRPPLGMLGPYELHEVIRQDAFGTVYRAFEPALQRPVAVEVLAAELSVGAARQAFLREARAAAALCHEHVALLHNVVQGTDGRPYLVREFIPGPTLQERLEQSGAFPISQIVRLGRQIALGLVAAHAQGLIHGDLQPARVLLERGERVKLIGFGMGRVVDAAATAGTCFTAGMPNYLAPEQAAGQAVDQRADLFSLGSLLYSLCTGHPPFRAASNPAVLQRILDEQPRPPSASNSEVPRWLDDMIARLQARDPDERMASAAEAAVVLQQHLEPERQEAPAEGRVAPLRAPSSRRFRLALGALAVILAAAAIARHSLLVPEAARTVDHPRQPNTSGVNAALPAADQVEEVRKELMRRNPGFDSKLGRYDKGEFGKPAAPFTDADVQRIAARPAAEQVEEVRQELMRRNPGFDGKFEHKTEGGVVTEFKIVTNKVTDIAPIRVFDALRVLGCRGMSNGLLADLTPLEGMNLAALTNLILLETKVGDAGMVHFKDCKNLTTLWLNDTQVGDAGMAHLQDCKALTSLHLAGTKLSNVGLAHFKDCKNLTGLYVDRTQVDDAGLAPFKGVPLRELAINDTAITDLTPLQGMPLEHIRLTPKNITRGLDELRDLKSLKTIGIAYRQTWPAAEFWQRYDKGEFK
jgi:eukaryotic-like serine/threonine-protein kinase